MTRQERMEDIKNRFDLALAERNFTEPGTENYKTLSECAKLILNEYQRMKRSKQHQHIRYGFRLYGTTYHIVTLNQHQRV